MAAPAFFYLFMSKCKQIGCRSVLKANFHQNCQGSATAVNRSPKIIETVVVNVGYSTGYGRGTARNRPQTSTLFTIRASCIFESYRFEALSQNTSTASLHLLINIHELASTPTQFTGYCNILYILYLWYKKLISGKEEMKVCVDASSIL